MTAEQALLGVGVGLVRPTIALFALPLAGTRTLPWPIQALVALTLAVAIGPELPVAAEPVRVMGLVLAEAVIGLGIGFSIGLVVAAARLGGEIVSNAIGLGFSALIDPEYGQSVPTVAQFMGLLATATFLAMDGHLALIAAIVDSYRTLPVGGVLSGAAVEQILGGGTAMFASGVAIAMPVIAATMIVQLALAVVARAAPALNLFAVGLPASLAVGLVAFALALPASVHPIRAMTGHALALVRAITAG